MALATIGQNPAPSDVEGDPWHTQPGVPALTWKDLEPTLCAECLPHIQALVEELQ